MDSNTAFAKNLYGACYLIDKNMEEPRRAQKFIDKVSNQKIFQSLRSSVSYQSKPCLISQNKLVCRNNLELFYANDNLIRCCTINNYNDSYKVLESNLIDFRIESLEINSSGTLLAAVGENNIVVVSLPSTIVSSQLPTISVQEYKLNKIGGLVRKVLWQPAIAGDCCLVVLNDKSQIKAYNLSLSTFEPQISIPLKNNNEFKDEEATSISFGSSDYLCGSLTLYIASDKNIFALFPFIDKYAKIAAKGSAVAVFLEEAKSVISIINADYAEDDEKFPSINKLKKFAISQYRYGVDLQRQIDTFRTGNNADYFQTTGINETFILTQKVDFCYELCLHGPLLPREDFQGLQDILQVYSNEHVSILVALRKESKSFVVCFYAQLSPLVMRLSFSCETNSSKTEQQNKKSSNDNNNILLNYVKPKKGFGYVDLSLIDEEESNGVENRNAFAENKKYFTKTCGLLTALLYDRVRGDSHTLSLRKTSDKNRFVIQRDNDLILADGTDWVHHFLTKGLHEDYLLFETGLLCNYDLIHKGDFELDSFILTSDIFDTANDYVIILQNSKGKGLIVKRLKEDYGFLQSSKACASETNFPDYAEGSLLKKEPIYEILNRLQHVKSSNSRPIELPTNINQEKISERIAKDPTSLKLFHEASSEVITKTLKSTDLALQLILRVDLEALDLRNQVNSLKVISNSREDIKGTSKIHGLQEKQEKIESRFDNLKRKIDSAIYQWLHTRSLPLSDAEQKWFRELNLIACHVSKDPNDNLELELERFRSQVFKLKNDLSTSETDNSALPISKIQEKEQVNEKLSRLRTWLEEKYKVSELAKFKLEESFREMSL